MNSKLIIAGVVFLFVIIAASIWFFTKDVDDDESNEDSDDESNEDSDEKSSENTTEDDNSDNTDDAQNVNTVGEECTRINDEPNFDENATSYAYATNNQDNLVCMPSQCKDGYEITGMPYICSVVPRTEPSTEQS